MPAKFRGVFSIIACVTAAFMLAAPAAAGGEPFVVSAGSNGDADYMQIYGDGSLSSAEALQLTQSSGITDYPLSFGNGLGDFDNDGLYDYIVGIGYGDGAVYISKKLDAGNQFAPPVNVAPWTEGYYAMDIAVADFNGDGNQDFVITHMYSYNCGLYLGDGNFGFTYSTLEDTAPYFSAGVDAADFNGDGFVDFVVAPNSDEEIYVNLNNGDGTFTKSTFPTHDGNSVYGIAAADFNNDRKADIAAASEDFLIIYTGNGDGTFQWAGSYEFDLNQSPIDNYDFDGDTYQDLVVGNFGAETQSVAILLNNGDGTFILDTTYPGTVGELYAVTAQPYEPNIDPVAVLDSNFFEVTAGEAIAFDGSQSYDEDGEIVAYAWDFGDGNTAAEGAAAQLTHVYSEAGQYVVTLTVTDNKGATASVQAEVNVAAAPVVVPEPSVSPVAVKVAFSPHKLKDKSRDKWFKVKIRVPSGYDAGQIDYASVKLVTEDGTVLAAYPDSKPHFLKKLFKAHRHGASLSIKFKRKDVSDALSEVSGQTVLKVEGKMLKDGESVDFAGSGTIKVTGKHKKHDKHAKH